MFGLIAAALALTCLCLHAVQRGATDDENDFKYKYFGSANDDDAEFTLTVYFMKRKNCANLFARFCQVERGKAG